MAAAPVQVRSCCRLEGVRVAASVKKKAVRRRENCAFASRRTDTEPRTAHQPTAHPESAEQCPPLCWRAQGRDSTKNRQCFQLSGPPPPPPPPPPATALERRRTRSTERVNAPTSAAGEGGGSRGIQPEIRRLSSLLTILDVE